MNKRIFITILILAIILSGDASGILDWANEKISWSLKWIIENIVGFFFREPINYVLGLKDDAWKEGYGLLGMLVNAMKWNPDLDIIRPMVGDIIGMLLPLYVVAMIITGFSWLFLSLSPQGRAKAKSMLLRLLVSMIFVSVSLPIYQLLLDISELLVNFVISLVGGIEMTGWAALFTATSIFLVAYFFPLAIVILLIVLFLIFAIRYVLLLLMGILFPLTIFFYFFQPTHGIGTKLMRFTLVLIFAPVVQAIFLIFSLIACGSDVCGASNEAAIALMFGGIVLMILAPWILAGFMMWVGSALFAYGFLKLPEWGPRYGVWGERACATLTFAGALMAGEGAGAVPLAGTIFFLAGLEHAGEEFAEKVARLPSRHHWNYNLRIRRFQRRQMTSGYSKTPKTPIQSRQKTSGSTKTRFQSGQKTSGSTKTPKTPIQSRQMTFRSTKTRFQSGQKTFRYPKKTPKTPEDFEKIANQLRNSKEYEEAAKYYRRAADSYVVGKDNEKAARNYFEAGRMYERLNMINMAVQEYEKAVKFAPENAEYHIRLADLYFRKG